MKRKTKIPLIACAILALITSVIYFAAKIFESNKADNSFSIYLLASISPQQLPIVNHLPLEDQPLISIKDIVSYTEETHEIELTSAGYEKIHRLKVPTNGIAFAVCLNESPVYSGAFWPAYSSQSFDGVVIDPILISQDPSTIQIKLGYPEPQFFTGEDPRSDPILLQSLKNAGKLK